MFEHTQSTVAENHMLENMKNVADFFSLHIVKETREIGLPKNAAHQTRNVIISSKNQSANGKRDGKHNKSIISNF